MPETSLGPPLFLYFFHVAPKRFKRLDLFDLRMWCRVSPLVALCLLVALVGQGNAIGVTRSEPTVHFSHTFDDLTGWRLDEGWGLTDNRAHEASSLYFGDDAGTPETTDNDVPCDPCSASASSPAFTIPSAAPAFLYFWFYGSYDSFFGSNYREGLSVIVTAEESTPVTVLRAEPTPGGFVKADLTPFSGMTVSLTLRFAQPEGPPPWAEGAYIDTLVVLDSDLIVANQVDLRTSSPVVEMEFTLLEAESHGRLLSGAVGFLSGEAASFTTTWQDGKLVSGFAWVGGEAETGIEFRVLDQADFSYVITSNRSGGVGGWLNKMLHDSPPGHYRIVRAFMGMEEVVNDLSFYTTSSVHGLRYGHGGYDIARLEARDFQTDTLFAAVHGGGIVMQDGRATVEAPGRALGLMYAWAQHEVSSAQSPEGASPPPPGFARAPFLLSEEPGLWSYQIDTAVSRASAPWFHLVGLPTLTEPVDLPAPDTSWFDDFAGVA